MKTMHTILVDRAYEALRALFRDTSVPLEKTLDDLETLRDEILDDIRQLKSDMENK